MNTPALHAVPDSGEIPADAPSYAEALRQIGHLEDVVLGLERDIRGWAARYAELRRDLSADAKANPLWEDAESLFAYWRMKCRHPRSRFSADRFFLVEPYLRKDGEKLCRQAIEGAAFDPYVTSRRNGSEKRHDGWDLIFKSRSQFEEFCNRAPREKP